MRQTLNDETSEALERLASKLRAINHWINEWSGSNSRFCIPAEETQRDPSSATTSFALEHPVESGGAHLSRKTRPRLALNRRGYFPFGYHASQ